MARPVICPACKKGHLAPFDVTATSVILTCDNCSVITTAKTKGGELVELALPGVAVVVGTYAILEFLGLEDPDELMDLFDTIL